MAKSYFFGYSERQLIDYIKSVGKAQNQRLRELEKRNLAKPSVAYKYLMKEKKRDNVNLALTQKGQIKFDLKRFPFFSSGFILLHCESVAVKSVNISFTASQLAK